MSWDGVIFAIYHSGAQKVTERYMHAIGTLPDSLWAARVIGAIGSRDVSEKRKEISDIISEIGKKVKKLDSCFLLMTLTDLLVRKFKRC